MLPSIMRPALILFAASCYSTASGHLLAQEPRSPLDALLVFVEQDVRTVVPPEMRPYEIGRVFLRLDSRIPERETIGSVGQDVVDRLHVELVDDTIRFDDMLVTVPGGGAHIREDGVYISMGAVAAEGPDALAITFVYYVTMRRPGRRPAVCLEERRVVVTLPRERRADSEIIDTRRHGGC